MSRHNKPPFEPVIPEQEQPIPDLTSTTIVTPVVEPMFTTSYDTHGPLTMEMARRCPLCWGTRQGTGTQYSGGPGGSRKYYKCGKCNHTWTATITIEKIVIEHRRVELETRGEE
jgi:hypothetical protein